jgi:hypothetical protein
MKLVLVCGPWSSGTTAVSGMLDQLGLNGLGPYFRTNDERTKNSFESLAFREVIDQLASDQTLALKVERKAAAQVLRNFRAQLEAQTPDAAAGKPEMRVFLKYPLSALLIPQICRVFDTRLIYVLRPLKDIEATRQRRKWAANFGAAGAQVLYSQMFQVLLDLSIPTMIVRYPELLAAPLPHARQLAAFCGIKADEKQIEAAAQFIRNT